MAEGSDEEEDGEPLTLDTVTIGATSRGLSVEDIKEMELGQIVDYVIEWNKINEVDEDPEAGKNKKTKTKTKKRRKRKANQADWDALLG